jgi:hypothetical protein
VDCFVEGEVRIAIEVKTGRISKMENLLEIAKDNQRLAQGLVDRVEWHFSQDMWGWRSRAHGSRRSSTPGPPHGEASLSPSPSSDDEYIALVRTRGEGLGKAAAKQRYEALVAMAGARVARLQTVVSEATGKPLPCEDVSVPVIWEFIRPSLREGVNTDLARIGDIAGDVHAAAREKGAVLDEKTRAKSIASLRATFSGPVAAPSALVYDAGFFLARLMLERSIDIEWALQSDRTQISFQEPVLRSRKNGLFVDILYDAQRMATRYIKERSAEDHLSRIYAMARHQLGL